MSNKFWRQIAIAAALGTIALNSISCAAAAQVKVQLPDAREFRDGDRWSAHVPGTNVYVGLKKINGKFVYASSSLDDYLKEQMPGNRKFTDLDGAGPSFPADHERLFAAPDGTLYGFFSGQWHGIEIGHRFPTILGPIAVTERMTQLQADAMSQELLRRAKMAKALPGINKTVLRPVITMKGDTPRINSGSAAPAGNSELNRNLRENLQLGKIGEGLQRVPFAVRRISNVDYRHGNADATTQPSPASQPSRNNALADMAAHAAARAVIVSAARYLVLR